MKRTILTGIAQAALALTATLAMVAAPAWADEPQSAPVLIPTPSLGTPGTATPTPYPQAKDQTLPGLESHDIKPKLQS